MISTNIFNLTSGYSLMTASFIKKSPLHLTMTSSRKILSPWLHGPTPGLCPSMLKNVPSCKWRLRKKKQPLFIYHPRGRAAQSITTWLPWYHHLQWSKLSENCWQFHVVKDDTLTCKKVIQKIVNTKLIPILRLVSGPWRFSTTAQLSCMSSIFQLGAHQNSNVYRSFTLVTQGTLKGRVISPLLLLFDLVLGTM